MFMKKYFALVFKRIISDKRIIITLAVVLLLYYALSHLVLHASCPVVLLTGFPCPGCGLTRACILLLSFRFKEAFELNPSAYIFFFLILWLIITRYLCGKEFKITKYLIIAGVILSFVVYIIGMKLYFPNRPPYTYMYDNLTLRLLRRR